MAYKEQRFTSAEKLIEHLSPTNRECWPRYRYIFRGQKRASHKLLPSSHRPFGKGVSAKDLWPGDEMHSYGQVCYELQMLRGFLDACDASGLQVPGDSPEVRTLLYSATFLLDKPSEWPPGPIQQVLATAQHHGVPTCLLDWTRSSWVAAYFAASGAVNEVDSDEDIAIWALDTGQKRFWDSVTLLEMPGGTAPNLAAQNGVFTVSKITSSDRDVFDPIPLEQRSELWEHPTSELPAFIKMTLPASEARKLLILCHDLGIKGSVLFPGYTGAAKEVRDFANSDFFRG